MKFRISERAKRIGGYAAFSASCLVFFLYVTFPYQAVRERMALEGQLAGWNVDVGSLGPGLFGVTAKNVQLRSAREGAPGPFIISSLALRPALFPPGTAFRAHVFGGVVSGSIGAVGPLRIALSLDGIDPSDGAVKAATGIDASGAIDGELNISIPREEGTVRSMQTFDLSRAAGAVSLTTSKLTVKGGTVTVPMYGQMTPVDLPRVALGDLDGRIAFDKGKGTVEKLRTKSEDLEVQGSGTLNLARRLDFSELNVLLKIKAEPEFLKRLGLIGAALSALAPDKENPAFRVAPITGYLGQPSLGRAGR